jgi:hypothetical protein
MKYFFARFVTFFEPKSFSTGVIYIEGVIPSGRSGGQLTIQHPESSALN